MNSFAELPSGAPTEPNEVHAPTIAKGLTQIIQPDTPQRRNHSVGTGVAALWVMVRS